ncbi:MAG: hypothetical protein NW701_11425 [Nitrospira sp.]
MMPIIRPSAVRSILMPALLALTLLSLVSSCGTKKPISSVPPTSLDFARALQYAHRAALAYEQDATIQERSGTGVGSANRVPPWKGWTDAPLY